MIVVLMGYMGSGKSTIGRDLAKTLNYKFLDLDDYIVENENGSISDIFNNKGEIYFRKKESEYLQNILNDKESIVLALGGGTPCYGKNLEKLLSDINVKTFYLKLSIPLLIERLFNEQDKRPLISHLNSKDELTEFIGKHLFERAQYYNRAEVVINVVNDSKQNIIEKILVNLI